MVISIFINSVLIIIILQEFYKQRIRLISLLYAVAIY